MQGGLDTGGRRVARPGNRAVSDPPDRAVRSLVDGAEDLLPVSLSLALQLGDPLREVGMQSHMVDQEEADAAEGVVRSAPRSCRPGARRRRT